MCVIYRQFMAPIEHLSMLLDSRVQSLSTIYAVTTMTIPTPIHPIPTCLHHSWVIRTIPEHPLPIPTSATWQIFWWTEKIWGSEIRHFQTFLDQQSLSVSQWFRRCLVWYQTSSFPSIQTVRTSQLYSVQQFSSHTDHKNLSVNISPAVVQQASISDHQLFSDNIRHLQCSS